MLLGDWNQDTFGSVEPLSQYSLQNAPTFSASPRQGVNVLQGLFNLYIQHRLLKFLISTAEELLHDYDQELLSGEIYAVQSEPPDLIDQQETQTTFHDFVRLASYRTHYDSMDFGRLKYLASSMAEAAQDHAWTLREDPGYFTETEAPG